MSSYAGNISDYDDIRIQVPHLEKHPLSYTKNKLILSDERTGKVYIQERRINLFCELSCVFGILCDIDGYPINTLLIALFDKIWVHD